ncbi:YopB/SseC family type III secretion system translocon subunit [bacterium]|nr:YopB/SseC family type III secretion system translocon subunit [bacterium]
MSIPSSTDPSWQNSGLSATELQQVATALGYKSIDDPNMPPITALSESQIVEIGLTVDPEVTTKLATYMNDVVEPVLEEPQTFDTSEMMMALAELNKELGEAGVDFAKEGIQINKESLKAKSEERLKKIQEAIKKLSQSDKSGKIGKIFGWIGIAVALVAAAAAVVLTGGAAMAIFAVAVAVVSAVVMGMQETGAMDKVLEAMGKAFGLQGDQLDKFKMWANIAIMAVLMIAGLVSGVGVAKALQGVELATQLAMTMSKVAQAAEVIGGAAAIGGGAATIASSVQGYEATMASAQAKEFMAWITKLQASIDQQTDELQKAMEQLQSLAFKDPKEILDKLAKTFMDVATSQSSSNFA